MAKVKNPQGKSFDVPEEGVDALVALGWEIVERDHPTEEPKKPSRARKAPETDK